MTGKSELPELVGQSPPIHALLATIRRLVTLSQTSSRPPAVLIEGETGTGKGLVASLLHRQSARAGARFVDVNCAAIPDHLMESELFGYERGAFTDARRAKPGLFHVAHRGTILLDEVGLLPEPLQAKLLKVIEERAVRRLGSNEPEPADAWIIAATNTNLLTAIAAHRFREDLYHRLAVVTLFLPPLRERAADIPLLADYFLARACKDHGLLPLTLTDDARARLMAHPWPGNVRELANTMERSALLCDSPQLTARLLRFTGPAVSLTASSAPHSQPDRAGSLDDAVKDRLLAVLEQTGGNIVRSAGILGIARNTLRAHMRRLRLEVPRRAPGVAPSVGSEEAPPPSSLSAPAVVPSAAVSRVAVRWERRLVTILRAVSAPPESAEGGIEPVRWLELMIEKILSFGGCVEEVSAASIEASFGAEPTEDATRRAGHAAVAIQKEVSRLPEDDPGRTSTRIVMHTRHALVCHVGSTARISGEIRKSMTSVLDVMLAEAPTGTIVVSAASAGLLRHRFALESVGPEMYRLIGSQPRRFEALGRRSVFVGRNPEIEVLLQLLDSAVGGRGRVVVLRGDAGVGKSRLVWEFTRARLRPAVRVLEASAAYARGGPYVPVIELLKSYFGVEPNDGETRIRELVADLVRTRVPELAADMSALLALLGVAGDHAVWDALHPAERRRRTIDAVKHLVALESRIQPLLVVFEDVHWIDAESQAVLDAFADQARASAVLFMMTCRRTYDHRWPVEHGHVELQIDPLAPTPATELLDGLLGTDDPLSPLKQRLIEWTGGNPFFLEESVQSLVETGALRAERNNYRLVTPIPEITLPATVEEILSDRIDRLALEDRSLLQSAAVIGSQVSWKVLAAITDIPGEKFDDQLRRLATAEMLYEAVAHDERQLVFKHPLTHEVAYRSLLPEQRRALHARVLSVLEIAQAEPDGDHVDRLASHAFRGGVWAKAVIYAQRAGERALRASASREAGQYFEQALSAVGHLPEDEVARGQAIDVRLGLRDVLWALARLPEIQDHLSEAQRMADALGDRRRGGAVACYSCQYFWSIGDYQRAIRAGERALQTADALPNPALAAEARFYLALAHLSAGQVRGAATLLTANLATLDAVAAQHGSEFASRRFAVHGPILVRGWMARVLAELGQFADAAAWGREALRAVENLDNPFAFTAATVGLGFLSLRKGEPAKAIEGLERALALCRAYDLGNWIATVAACLGTAYVGVGRVDAGVPLLEEAVEERTRTGIVASHSLWRVCLGEAYLAAGRMAEAVETARAALEQCRESGAQGDEGWALRLLGKIAAATTPFDRDAAQASYQAALALAQKLEMRPLEARCHFELGRFLERIGEAADGRAHVVRAGALFRELGMPVDAEPTRG